MEEKFGKIALLINCAHYKNIPGILSSSMEKTYFLTRAGFNNVMVPEKHDKASIEETIADFLKIADKYKTRLIWIAGKFGDPSGAFLLPDDIRHNGMNPSIPAPKSSDEGVDIYPLFNELKQCEQTDKENFFIVESGYRFGNNQFASVASDVQGSYMAPAASLNLGNLPSNSVLLHIDGVAAARAVNLGKVSWSYLSILNSKCDGKKSLYDMLYETAETFNSADLKDLKDKYKKFSKGHARTAGLSLYDNREGVTPRQVFSANMVNEF